MGGAKESVKEGQGWSWEGSENAGGERERGGDPGGSRPESRATGAFSVDEGG